MGPMTLAFRALPQVPNSLANATDTVRFTHRSSRYVTLISPWPGGARPPRKNENRVADGHEIASVMVADRNINLIRPTLTHL